MDKIEIKQPSSSKPKPTKGIIQKRRYIFVIILRIQGSLTKPQQPAA